MHDWWTTRQLREPEQMDAADVDPTRLRSALRFIRRVNALLGYTRATINHLDAMTRNRPAGRTLTVLDVATGSADVPHAVAGWAKRRGIHVVCVGLDLHEQTLTFAHQLAKQEHPLVRGDAMQLPFEDGTFDVVMTSMFTHHLPEEAVVDVLREMDRVARVGIIVADLTRSRRAHRWITLFTLLSDPMVRHDARVSVRQAFTIPEIDTLACQAGIEYARARPHFGHRFVLSGRKSGTASATNPSAP
jgi:2-polyprenyl-3-methyl-5-hydroxy-6-metoxy-1,4-benzoquinol methylase